MTVQVLCAEHADAHAEEVEDYYCEEGYYKGGNDGADDLDALLPNEVVPTESVDCRPYTVVEVKPKRHEPDEVEDAINLTTNGCGEERLDISGTVLRVESAGVDACEFGKLHLEPEIVEVEHNETEHADAQHEHVLRLPVNAFLTRLDGITVVAARVAVLDGEPDGIREVDEHQQGKPEGTDDGIPVGAEHAANPVVGILGEDECEVHRTMKQEKKYQCEAGNTHDELTAD